MRARVRVRVEGEGRGFSCVGVALLGDGGGVVDGHAVQLGVLLPVVVQDEQQLLLRVRLRARARARVGARARMSSSSWSG